jgi:hypothetical protein
MAVPEALDTHHKALSINLESSIFGSFAEIGAGQEVARWFLKVGAASGTVAKTISAYDKEVSDDIYGAGSRYVSQERLEAMLEHEWSELLTQLETTRGAQTRFFSFVNTIAARNYSGTNYANGWLGLRFRADIGGPPNDIILHINLLDPTNLQQQDAVGILGVNLIFAAYHERSDPSTFLKGLAQFVAPDHIEVDYIDVRGPAFDSIAEWSDDAVHARLVLEDLSEGVVFPANKSLLAPADLFHKKAVVLAPGKFHHVEQFHAEMMSKGIEALVAENGFSAADVLGLYCISSKPSSESEERASVNEILEHLAELREFGHGVLLVRDRELYRMSAFAKRFTTLPIRFVAGISLLVRVLSDNYEANLGSRLEGIARMFTQNVRMYAYPMPEPMLKDWIEEHGVCGWQWTPVNGWVTADKLVPGLPGRFLYEYLHACNMIVPLHDPTPQRTTSSTTSAG